jgi:myo-inositol catabolism protein IolS
MKYKFLGKTKIKISNIALGGDQLGGGLDWGEQDRNTSISTIKTAADLGVNFFDTAEMYGDGLSEEIIGDALKKIRDKVVIASKIHRTPMTKSLVKTACEESLKRLKTEYIDLYQIHFIDRNVPFDETMQGFIELKEEGKIRAIGVCNSGVKDIKKFLDITEIQSNQMPYSLLWRSIEFDIKVKCISSDISLICYSPLLMGLLTGKFKSADEVPLGRARTRHFSKERKFTRHGEPGFEKETFKTINDINKICNEFNIPMNIAAIAWVMAQKGVTSVIIGARNPDQLKENLKATDLVLPEDLLKSLTSASDNLKELLGHNPDLWQHEPRME